MKPDWRSIFAASVLAAAAPALAAQHDIHASIKAAPATQAGATLSEGEVRKVDKEAGKVTLRHGAIANLEMPAMTMVFRVKDPALLDTLKKGDKIRFRAEKVSGAFTVTEVVR